VGVVDICSTFYMVHKWAQSIAARHSTWYRSGCCGVLLDFLHGTEAGAAELLNILHCREMEAAISARHSICFRNGATDLSSTVCMVRKWELASSAQYSNGTKVAAVVFPSNFYMVQNRALFSSPRLYSWYRSRRRHVLLDILHGTEVGAVGFCSTFYMVQKWVMSN